MSTHDATQDLLAEMEQITSILAYSKSSGSLDHSQGLPQSPTKSVLSFASNGTIIQSEKFKHPNEFILDIEEIHTIPTTVTPVSSNISKNLNTLILQHQHQSEDEADEYEDAVKSGKRLEEANTSDGSDGDDDDDTSYNKSLASDAGCKNETVAFQMPNNNGNFHSTRHSSTNSLGLYTHDLDAERPKKLFNKNNANINRRVSSYGLTTDDDFQSATEEMEKGFTLDGDENVLFEQKVFSMENGTQMQNITNKTESELKSETEEDDETTTMGDETIDMEDFLPPPTFSAGNTESTGNHPITPSPQFSTKSSQFSGQPHQLSPASSAGFSVDHQNKTTVAMQSADTVKQELVSPKLTQDFKFKARIISNSENQYIHNRYDDVLKFATFDEDTENDEEYVFYTDTPGIKPLTTNLDPLRRNTIRSKALQKTFEINRSSKFFTKDADNMENKTPKGTERVVSNHEKLKALVGPTSSRATSSSSTDSKNALNQSKVDDVLDTVNESSNKKHMEYVIGNQERTFIESWKASLLPDLDLPDTNLNDEIMRHIYSSDSEHALWGETQSNKEATISNPRSSQIWSGSPQNTALEDKELVKSESKTNLAARKTHTKRDSYDIENILKPSLAQKYPFTVSQSNERDLPSSNPFRASTMATGNSVIMDREALVSGMNIFKDHDYEVENNVQSMNINDMINEEGSNVVIESLPVVTKIQQPETPTLKQVDLYPIEDVFFEAPSTPTGGKAPLATDIESKECPEKLHIGSPFKVKSTHNPTFSVTEVDVAQPEKPSVQFDPDVQYKFVKSDKFCDMGQMYVRVCQLSDLSCFKQGGGFEKRDAEFSIIFDNGINLIKTPWEKITSESVNHDGSVDVAFSGKEFETIIPLKDENIDHQTSLMNVKLTLQLKYKKVPDTIVEVQEKVPIYVSDVAQPGLPLTSNNIVSLPKPQTSSSSKKTSPFSSVFKFGKSSKKTNRSNTQQQDPRQQEQKYFSSKRSSGEVTKKNTRVEYQIVTKKMVKHSPDHWNKVIAPDGSFGVIDFDITLQFLNEYRYKTQSLFLPVYNKWDQTNGGYNRNSLDINHHKNGGKPKIIGKLKLDVCYLPRQNNLERFPKTLEKAMKIIEKYNEQTQIQYEGWLWQEGGDITSDMMSCRRFFKLKGVDLVGYHELTRNEKVKFNMLNVERVSYGRGYGSDCDDSGHDEATKTTQTRNVSNPLMHDYFQLLFNNGEVIKFIANSHQEKIEWLVHLEKVVQLNITHQPWVDEFAKTNSKIV